MKVVVKNIYSVQVVYWDYDTPVDGVNSLKERVCKCIHPLSILTV